MNRLGGSRNSFPPVRASASIGRKVTGMRARTLVVMVWLFRLRCSAAPPMR